MVVSASGIWSRGVNLIGVTDLNVGNPTGTYTYTIDNAAGSPVGSYTTPIYTTPRPNTKYGAVYENTNGVSSFYDGLVLTFEKKFTHGFQSLVSYTWSHEIDDGQGAGSNAIFFSGINTLYDGNYAAEKGSGALDQRHRLVYSFAYAPEFLHSTAPVAKYLVNNWQLSGIVTLAAGRPAGSPTIKESSPAVSNLLSSTYIDGYGGTTRVPFLPVDSIYTPASYRADLRLTKNIPFNIKEREVKATLNFEVFNVSNSWSPTSMATQEYTLAKGVLTPSPTAYGYGTADGGFPDGTQARRLQVSIRASF